MRENVALKSSTFRREKMFLYKILILVSRIFQWEFKGIALLRIPFLTALYFLFARLSQLIAISPDGIVAVWPPSGVFLGSYFLSAKKDRPYYAASIFVGEIFFAHLVGGFSWSTALVFAVSLVLEGVLTAHLFLNWNQNSFQISNIKHLFKFLAIGPLLIIPLLAFVPSLYLSGSVNAQFWFDWRLWWISDATGMLLMTPLLLSWSEFKWKNISSIHFIKKIEVTFIISSVAGMSYLVFCGPQINQFLQFPYIVYPFLIVAALRCGKMGVSFCLFFLTFISVWGTNSGIGYFGQITQNSTDNVIMMQIFLSVTMVSIFILNTLIQEREIINAELSKNKAFLTGITENSNAMIYVKDLSKRYVHMNREFLDVMNLKYDEVIGKNDSEILLRKAILETDSYETNFNNLGEAKIVEESFKTNGLTKYFLTVKSPLFNAAGKRIAYCGISTDITDRKILQKEKEVLFENEIQAKQKLEQMYLELKRLSLLKDEFLQTVTHELRTPLTAILGWAELLSLKEVSGEIAEQGLNSILRSAQVQSGLIDDLLDISDLLSGTSKNKFEVICFNDVVNDVIQALSSLATSKNISVNYENKIPGFLLDGDLKRIQHCIQNVLGNSLKFTPENGSVNICIKQVNTTIVFEISDNGIGIAPEVLPHIFERFHQADSKLTRKFGGLGLGLSIAKEIVQLHGGEIEAQSEGLNRGACFKMTFPVNQQAAKLQQKDDTEIVFKFEIGQQNLGLNE